MSLSLLIGKINAVTKESYKGEYAMNVVNVTDLPIFSSENLIDHDESWAIKLLNECEQERTHNTPHLQDEPIFVDSQPIMPVSSASPSSMETTSTIENTHSPSAIEIQILAAKQTKQLPLEQPSFKSNINLRTLFRNR